ncbi:MAG: methyl-accepting chemotaxis protein [Vallitalea sp.]|jgi:methyl-accepting chemotaxis protein|nr:methyl-accepting chemotaxis protein [Vallitalea sp.]
MKKIRQKKTSIRRKLIVFPLVIMLIGIISIGSVSSWLVRDSLLKQMKKDGINFANNIIEQIKDNTLSLTTIDKMLEDKIRIAGKVVIENKDALSSDYLKSIAKSLNVDELYWFTSEGKIIYSTAKDYLGWIPPKGHPIDDFKLSNKKEIFEEIRADSEFGNLVKYGALKSPDGCLVQVGIKANEVKELKEKFNYQTLAEELSINKSLVYVAIVDKDKTIIAHNNEDRINVKLEDKNLSKAIENKETYAFEYFYPAQKIKVYNVIIPIFIDEEYIGSLNIGLSMEGIYSAINENVKMIVIFGMLVFIILALFLGNLSKDTIKSINKIKVSLGNLSLGDFTKEIPKELLRKTDEFGEISNALNNMKKSIEVIIRNIGKSSEHITKSSDQLSTTSHEVAIAANEVARALDEVAKGADDQAQETENGAKSINVLGDVIEKNQQLMNKLNISTKEVEEYKNEGMKTLNFLVEKTNDTEKVTGEVREVIIDTNKSAEKIENASHMIKNIADQTNLLALNAAIEAARAGDTGKGFAVVADEIRKLAEQSTNFTDEIDLVIKSLAYKTEKAVASMGEVGQIVTLQTKGVEDTTNKFDKIADALEEMKDVIKNLNYTGKEMEKQKGIMIDTIESLAAIAEENAASTQEVAATTEEQTASIVEVDNSSKELKNLASEMKESISKFKY